MTVMMSAGPSADRSEVLIVDGQELRLTSPDRVLYPATGTNQIGRHRVLHDGRAGDTPASGGTASDAEALAERDRRAVLLRQRGRVRDPGVAVAGPGGAAVGRQVLPATGLLCGVGVAGSGVRASEWAWLAATQLEAVDRIAAARSEWRWMKDRWTPAVRATPEMVKAAPVCSRWVIARATRFRRFAVSRDRERRSASMAVGALVMVGPPRWVSRGCRGGLIAGWSGQS